MSRKRFKTLSAQHSVQAPGLRPVALGRRQDVVELWSEREAAAVIGVSAQSLSRWRKAGIGPAYLRLGRKVRYRPGDVTAWIRRSGPAPDRGVLMIVVRRIKAGRPRYLVRYETPLGREVSKTFSRRSDAEAWERSVKDSGSSGIGLPASRSARTRTVSELWADVLATRGSRWETRTQAGYIELFRLHVQPHFGRAKGSAITARDVRLWVQTLRARGLAPATAARCVSVLSAVMRDAIEKRFEVRQSVRWRTAESRCTRGPTGVDRYGGRGAAGSCSVS